MEGFVLNTLPRLIMAVLYLIMGFYFYKLIKCFVPIRNNKLVKLFALLGLSGIVSIIVIINDMFNVSFALVIFIMLMLLCYNGSTIKKVSVVLILYPIVISFNLLGYNTISLYIKEDVFYVIYLLLMLSVLCVAWFVIYKLIKSKVEFASMYIHDRTWLLIDIICFAPFISIIAVTILTGRNEVYKTYPIAVACIISNIGILMLIEYIIKNVKIKLENRNYKIQYNYYKSLEEKQIEVRKLRHDMNNHLQVIRSFLESDDMENAKEYFNQLSIKSEAGDNKLFCENSIVNAIINTKYNSIINNQIDPLFNIGIHNILSIEEIDLCSLFANTLDNAIEACLKIKDPLKRHITLKARTEKGYFSYSIKNSKDNDILLSPKGVYSDKKNKEYHGFGLQSVKDIVDKYKGTMDISYTESEFILYIIIKI